MRLGRTPLVRMAQIRHQIAGLDERQSGRGKATTQSGSVPNKPLSLPFHPRRSMPRYSTIVFSRFHGHKADSTLRVAADIVKAC